LIVTGSRGEYGYIRPIIQKLKTSKTMDYETVVTNMHLLPEFGSSIREFQKDDIRVDHRIYMALSGYTNLTMVKSLGIFMLSFTDIIGRQAPDIILLAGDRGEQLVAALAGAHMNIPVAHIQAGEVSGNIDGMTRHAIARYAHIHFASNEDACLRLTKMGEEKFRIFRVGAPQLDELKQSHITDKRFIQEKFFIDLHKPLILVVQHPVTEQSAFAEQQMTATMKAIAEIGHQTIVLYPNNDAGSMAIQNCILQNRHINIRVERNLSREDFAGLLNVASVIVGNSSCGIIEAPSFKLPAVNIGRRQDGRLQAKNVINVPEHDSEKIKSAIRKALTKKYRNSLRSLRNPYGDGRSSERIIRILESIPIDEKLLFKRISY
jgi:GDP/UDP-N,N'-diacetylbacillosamine 2-epimerase (hydrolysing)